MNDIKKALKYYKKLEINKEYGITDVRKIGELNKIIRIAIDCMEKQVAKMPDFEGDGYADGKLVYDTWICPSCDKHYEVDYDDYKYCPNCGQHILTTEPRGDQS